MEGFTIIDGVVAAVIVLSALLALCVSWRTNRYVKHGSMVTGMRTVVPMELVLAARNVG